MCDPYEGDSLTTKHEHNNRHDKYAIAVIPVDSKNKPVVGHLPREISKECCFFILHGGIILWVVNGRRRKTTEPCGGMEIPCVLTFRHPKKRLLERVKLSIVAKYEFMERELLMYDCSSIIVVYLFI